MSCDTAVAEAIAAVVRDERGKVIAALARTTHDLDLAEDAFQDAVTRALEVWPETGIPASPPAWVTTAAQHRAIDRLRRARRQVADPTVALAALERSMQRPDDARSLPDERLELIFACCHPALALDAQVALTLRTLGGLTTEEIARAFLVSEATLAQRLVRAKRKLRASGIPFEVPPPERLDERLRAVAAVVYLIFSEGYAASGGDARIRGELCEEAIRLGRLLCVLLPGEAELLGLTALMLLHDARRDTRADAHGAVVPLEEQDRSRWDRARIAEGDRLLDRALGLERPGPYQVQAAIAALHANAPDAVATDWRQIALLYGALARWLPSPMIELNRAAAVGMADGPAAGLVLLDRVHADATLAGHHAPAAARADLLRRAGRRAEAATAYARALELVANSAERAFLSRRLDEVLEREPG